MLGYGELHKKYQHLEDGRTQRVGLFFPRQPFASRVSSQIGRRSGEQSASLLQDAQLFVSETCKYVTSYSKAGGAEWRRLSRGSGSSCSPRRTVRTELSAELGELAMGRRRDQEPGDANGF